VKGTEAIFLGEGKTQKRSDSCLPLSEGLSSGRGFSLILNLLEGRTRTNRQKPQTGKFKINAIKSLGAARRSEEWRLPGQLGRTCHLGYSSHTAKLGTAPMDALEVRLTDV
jgi:hypothetical protein